MTIDMLSFANELLSRGIKNKDQEMINTAQKIINENVSISTTKKPVRSKKAVIQMEAPEDMEAVVTSNRPAGRDRVIDMSQFKMDNREEGSKRNGIAVNKIKRPKNTFVDDLTLNMDAITPQMKPVPREREKASKVMVECYQCHSREIVDPIHARETFMCESCILGNKKGKR